MRTAASSARAGPGPSTPAADSKSRATSTTSAAPHSRAAAITRSRPGSVTTSRGRTWPIRPACSASALRGLAVTRIEPVYAEASQVNR